MKTSCSSEDKKRLVMLESVDKIDEFTSILKGAVSIISDMQTVETDMVDYHQWHLNKYNVLDVVLYKLLEDMEQLRDKVDVARNG